MAVCFTIGLILFLCGSSCRKFNFKFVNNGKTWKSIWRYVFVNRSLKSFPLYRKICLTYQFIFFKKSVFMNSFLLACNMLASHFAGVTSFFEWKLDIVIEMVMSKLARGNCNRSRPVFIKYHIHDSLKEGVIFLNVRVFLSN